MNSRQSPFPGAPRPFSSASLLLLAAACTTVTPDDDSASHGSSPSAEENPRASETGAEEGPRTGESGVEDVTRDFGGEDGNLTNGEAEFDTDTGVNREHSADTSQAQMAQDATQEATTGERPALAPEDSDPETRELTEDTIDTLEDDDVAPDTREVEDESVAENGERPTDPTEEDDPSGTQTGDEGSAIPPGCAPSDVRLPVEDLDAPLPEREVSARQLIEELEGTLRGVFTDDATEGTFPSAIELAYVEGTATLTLWGGIERSVDGGASAVGCPAPELNASYSAVLSIPGIVSGTFTVDHEWGRYSSYGYVPEEDLSVDGTPPVDPAYPEGTRYGAVLFILPKRDSDAVDSRLTWQADFPDGAATMLTWGDMDLAWE